MRGNARQKRTARVVSLLPNDEDLVTRRTSISSSRRFHATPSCVSRAYYIVKEEEERETLEEGRAPSSKWSACMEI